MSRSGLGAFPIEALPAETPGSAESGVPEAYATVPGARIFYRDTGGGGVPLILLHAPTGWSRVWEYPQELTLAGGLGGDQHGLQNLIPYFLDGTRQMAQKERVRFVAFAN